MSDAFDPLRAFEVLNARYCHSIDEDRLEEWPLYFTETGRYEIIARESRKQGLPIGAMYCDSRGMMQDRVTSVRRVLVFEPHTYRHTVSATLIKEATPGRLLVRSNFVVLRISEISGDTIIFASGSYDDEIVRHGTELLFPRRIVLLDANKLHTGLVIPL
jgi:anthranilate 1,2-dioxygenase small subunit